ncbi:MAG TPA: polyprenyl synthetase family protein [Kofleriaceae bacterium]|nr:polyprenyl synthetase family protein [Kofleriaceae bacterium]
MTQLALSRAVLDRLAHVSAARGAPSLAERLASLDRWVRADLVAFEAELEAIPRGARAVHAAAHHLLDLRGKHLRPLCVALTSRFGDGFTERARGLAVAVELVHSATLLHDDVVDVGERRRGEPTARVVYGNAASIFAGDWLLVAALRRIAAAGVEGVLDRMLTVIDVLARDVVRLAEPVLSIARERTRRVRADETLESADGLREVGTLERVERSVVRRLLAARTHRGTSAGRRRTRRRRAGGRRTARTTDTAQRLERREALLEIAVQRARLVLSTVALVLQHLDLAADRAQIRLQRVDALRQLEQALVCQHALDPLHPAVEILEADLHRIFFGRDRAADDTEAAQHHRGQGKFHGDLDRLLQVHDLDAAIRGVSLFVAARDGRPLLTVRHRAELRLGDTLQHQRPTHGLRAAFTETDVVLARAALVGVAFETDLLRRGAGEVARMRGDHGLRIGTDLRAVEIEIHDALREQLARRALRRRFIGGGIGVVDGVGVRCLRGRRRRLFRRFAGAAHQQTEGSED